MLKHFTTIKGAMERRKDKKWLRQTILFLCSPLICCSLFWTCSAVSQLAHHKAHVASSKTDAKTSKYLRRGPCKLAYSINHFAFPNSTSYHPVAKPSAIKALWSYRQSCALRHKYLHPGINTTISTSSLSQCNKNILSLLIGYAHSRAWKSFIVAVPTCNLAS